MDKIAQRKRLYLGLTKEEDTFAVKLATKLYEEAFSPRFMHDMAQEVILRGVANIRVSLDEHANLSLDMVRTVKDEPT